MTVHRGKRAVALVSGGLDSVVSLAQAVDTMDVRLVLFFDYGQRALQRERDAVLGVVNFYGLPVREVALPWLADLLPDGLRARRSADEPEPPLMTLDAVWVPNRNGVFVNAAAAFAESYDCEVIVTGFNREEGEEFPDNAVEYVSRANSALEMSCRRPVRLVSFTQDLAKPGIIELGTRLRAPLSVIWSCYRDGDMMCGSCASCMRLKSALESVGPDVRPAVRFQAASAS